MSECEPPKIEVLLAFRNDTPSNEREGQLGPFPGETDVEGKLHGGHSDAGLVLKLASVSTSKVKATYGVTIDGRDGEFAAVEDGERELPTSIAVGFALVSDFPDQIDLQDVPCSPSFSDSGSHNLSQPWEMSAWRELVGNAMSNAEDVHQSSRLERTGQR